MQATERSLVELAADLMEAKAAEDKAKRKRLDVEAAIVSRTGFAKAEGSQTYSEENEHGSCKVVLEQPINRGVDSGAWFELRKRLPKSHPAHGIFREKFELATKEARLLQEQDPAAFAEVSHVITSKPGKVSIDVKNVAVTRGGA